MARITVKRKMELPMPSVSGDFGTSTDTRKSCLFMYSVQTNSSNSAWLPQCILSFRQLLYVISQNEKMLTVLLLNIEWVCSL